MIIATYHKGIFLPELKVVIYARCSFGIQREESIKVKSVIALLTTNTTAILSLALMQTA